MSTSIQAAGVSAAETGTATGIVSQRVGLRAPIVFALAVLLAVALPYSVVGTALGGWLFPYQAGGSIVDRNGVAVGAALVAQPFAGAGYFHPRPSAAKYDPMSAAGSNQARSNPDLLARVAATRGEVATRDGIAPAAVAGDLGTQSGSGMDPHISPAGAAEQTARVAAARGLPVATVAALVASGTDAPTLGVLGAARVNVLALNLALDAAAPAIAPLPATPPATPPTPRASAVPLPTPAP